MSHAGTALLLRAGEKTGLLDELSQALAPWRKPLATPLHDPGKIVFDLAVSVAIGGDCLADIAAGDRDVFGPVASDPTVSRLITTLAAEVGPRWRRSTPPALLLAPTPGMRPGAAAPRRTALRVGWWWWIWMRAC